MPGSIRTPVSRRTESDEKASYDEADQAVTRSSGSALYGYQSAAATTDVVSSGRSRASTSTRYPASASRTAQLKPVTPAPTTTTRPTAPAWQVDSPLVRLVVARCQVDYAGRLTAHLPMATRVLMLKSDGSVLVHSDGGSYKPLNWMSPPCTVREGTTEDGQVEWTVDAKTGDSLRILIEEVLHDSSHDLGVDPGLQKDGVEKHLQELLADHPSTLADGLTLVRREFPTAIGPVDLMCRDADGKSVAVEIKRRGEIDGVEQLTRYLELLNRDPLVRKGAVRGIFAAQEIKPQARVLADGPRDRLRGRRLRPAARHGRPDGPTLLSRPSALSR